MDYPSVFSPNARKYGPRKLHFHVNQHLFLLSLTYIFLQNSSLPNDSSRTSRSWAAISHLWYRMMQSCKKFVFLPVFSYYFCVSLVLLLRNLNVHLHAGDQKVDKKMRKTGIVGRAWRQKIDVTHSKCFCAHFLCNLTFPTLFITRIW